MGGGSGGSATSGRASASFDRAAAVICPTASAPTRASWLSCASAAACTPRLTAAMTSSAMALHVRPRGSGQPRPHQHHKIS